MYFLENSFFVLIELKILRVIQGLLLNRNSFLDITCKGARKSSAVLQINRTDFCGHICKILGTVKIDSH